MSRTGKLDIPCQHHTDSGDKAQSKQHARKRGCTVEESHQGDRHIASATRNHKPSLLLQPTWQRTARKGLLHYQRFATKLAGRRYLHSISSHRSCSQMALLLLTSCIPRGQNVHPSWWYHCKNIYFINIIITRVEFRIKTNYLRVNTQEYVGADLWTETLCVV